MGGRWNAHCDGKDVTLVVRVWDVCLFDFLGGKRSWLQGLVDEGDSGGGVFSGQDYAFCSWKRGCAGKGGQAQVIECSFFLHVGEYHLLRIENWSSPVQRDLSILLRLHRLLIFACCDWCHDAMYTG